MNTQKQTRLFHIIIAYLIGAGVELIMATEQVSIGIGFFVGALVGVVVFAVFAAVYKRD